MNAIKSTEHYKARIKSEINNTLTETNLQAGDKRTGKVRDQYDLGDKIALITTDRQSAFDRVLIINNMLGLFKPPGTSKV